MLIILFLLYICYTASGSIHGEICPAVGPKAHTAGVHPPPNHFKLAYPQQIDDRFSDIIS